MFDYSAFDVTDGAVLLRIICGAFFFPHIYFKLVGNPPPALAYFVQAGFRPPQVYMRLAAVTETIAGLGLVLGIYTPWAALLAAANLTVAAVSINFFNREVRWLWNLNGMEFPVFWVLACLAVAALHWHQI